MKEPIATINTNKKLINIINAAESANVQLHGVEHNGQDFFTIWFYASNVKDKLDIRRELKKIDDIDFCQGEHGYIAAKGYFLNVKYW